MKKKELTLMIKNELNKRNNPKIISAKVLDEIAKKCNCNMYCVMSVARYGRIF